LAAVYGKFQIYGKTNRNFQNAFRGKFEIPLNF